MNWLSESENHFKLLTGYSKLLYIDTPQLFQADVNGVLLTASIWYVCYCRGSECPAFQSRRSELRSPNSRYIMTSTFPVVLHTEREFACHNQVDSRMGGGSLQFTHVQLVSAQSIKKKTATPSIFIWDQQSNKSLSLESVFIVFIPPSSSSN